MARPISSWLSGPPSTETGEYPGERLGAPRCGPGSLAGFGRRVVALLVDWLTAYGLAALGLAVGAIGPAQLSTAVLLVWLALGVLSVRLYGFTPGQFACGLRVATIGTVGTVDRHIGVGLGRAAARGLLIALVIPALFTDGDGRGLHDRITGTAVVRR